MDISNFTYESLNKYFNTLSYIGYVKETDVIKLLALSFIEEFITSDMVRYFTDEDFRTLDKALACLYGSSCLIQYPNCEGTDVFNILSDYYYPRITEDDIIRHTEDGQVRHPEQQ